MFKDLDEAVAAIRSARSLEELKSLVNENHVPQDSADKASETQASREKVGIVRYVTVGFFLCVSIFGCLCGFFAFWISLLCALYWLWQVDVTGIIHSLVWAAGSFAVLAISMKIYEPSESWFRQRQAPDGAAPKDANVPIDTAPASGQ